MRGETDRDDTLKSKKKQKIALIYRKPVLIWNFFTFRKQCKSKTHILYLFTVIMIGNNSPFSFYKIFFLYFKGVLYTN